MNRNREDHTCRRGFPEALGGYSGDFLVPGGGWSGQVSRGRVPGEESTEVVCEDSPGEESTGVVCEDSPGGKSPGEDLK